MDIGAYLKEHPKAVIGGAIAAAVLVYLLRGSSQPANPALSYLSASLQSQGLSVQQNVALAQSNNALAAANSNYGSQVAIAQAQVAASNTMYNDQAIAGIVTQYLNSNNNAAAISAQKQVQDATIAAQHDIAIQGYNNNLAMLNSNNNAQLTALTQNLGFESTNLPQLLNYSTNIANINNSAAIATAQAQAQAIKDTAYSNFLNSIVGGSTTMPGYSTPGIIPGLVNAGATAGGLFSLGSGLSSWLGGGSGLGASLLTA